MKAKLIIKGVLLHVTTLATILFICGIESIVESGYLIPYIIVMAILIFSCYRCISYRELHKLTFSRWFNKLIDK